MLYTVFVLEVEVVFVPPNTQQNWSIFFKNNSHAFDNFDNFSHVVGVVSKESVSRLR